MSHLNLSFFVVSKTSFLNIVCPISWQGLDFAFIGELM